jgi:uncharacterized membrane protein YdcZ (DUF606 family)
LWVDSGGQVSYAYEPIVSSSNPGEQFGLDAVSGPSSPITVTSPATLTGNYVTQYYLTVQTSPSGVNSPSGQGWYNTGDYATVETPQYIDIVSGSSRYNFIGWTTGNMTEITSSTSPLTTVLMDKAKTVTANYVTQYNITFDKSGVGSDFTGTVVDIDGTNYSYIGLPAVFWWDANSAHNFTYQSPLIVNPSAEQYVWISTTGLSTLESDTIEATTSGTITGNYKMQYYLTLVTNPSGVNSPLGAGWYDPGTNATISTDAFVNITLGSSRYRFNGWTTADMAEIADPTRSPTTVLMDEAKTVTADYVVQYYVTLGQSGVGSDFTSTIVKVDGINYTNSNLPYHYWWDDGSTHTFAYQSPLVVTAYGKQYNWTSTTGLSTSQTGSIIVTTSGSLTGNYKTQYYLTVNSLYDSPDPSSQWFDDGAMINANVASMTTGPQGVRQLCTGWTGTGSVPSSGSGTSFSFTISQLSSITWNWKVQYYLTVQTNPSGIATILGEGWYDEMTPVTLTAPKVQNYNFTYWDVDGPSEGTGVNPITVMMDVPHTATAHYSGLAAPLTVSISPTMTSITLGQSVTFTSTVTGGTAPYSYQWYLNGNPVAGATSNTWTFIPTLGGTYYVYLAVKDASNNTASSTLARTIVTAGPIGGYAVSFTEPEPAAAPAAAYFGLVALFGIALIVVRRKRK